MHVDAHVASEVSESGHHIGDKFCVVVHDKKLHPSSSTALIEFSKSASLMSSRI